MSSIIQFNHRELKQKKLRLMPGGPRSISLIEEVKPESTVYVDPENNLRLVGRDEKMNVAALIPKDAEARAFNEGWVAYFQSRLLSGDQLLTLKSSWQVPPEPATANEQTIFLFNGAQTLGSRNSILQPVLQWSTDEETGDQSWTVASYLVSSTRQAKHTPFVKVNPGQQLTGLIQFVKTEGQNFVYSVEFVNIPKSKMFIRTSKEYLMLFNTLEIYDIQTCSDLPDTNKTEFFNIEVKTKNGTQVKWVEKDATNACGLGCARDSQGRLIVFY
jgi:hypothetical protein